MNINVISRLLTVNRQYITSISTVDNHITINTRDKSLPLTYNATPLDLEKFDQTKCRISLKSEGQMYLLTTDAVLSVAIVIRGQVYTIPDPNAIRHFLEQNTSKNQEDGSYIITDIAGTDVFNLGFFWIYSGLQKPSHPETLYGKTLTAINTDYGTPVDYNEYVEFTGKNPLFTDLVWFTPTCEVIHMNCTNRTASDITAAFYREVDSIPDDNISLDNEDWVYPAEEDGIWTAPKYVGMVDHILDASKYVLDTTVPSSFERITPPKSNAYAQYELGDYGRYGCVVIEDQITLGKITNVVGSKNAALFSGHGFEAIFTKRYPSMMFVRAVETPPSHTVLDIDSLKATPITAEQQLEIDEERQESNSWDIGDTLADYTERLSRAQAATTAREQLELEHQYRSSGDRFLDELETALKHETKPTYVPPTDLADTRYANIVLNYPPLQCSRIDVDSIVPKMIPNLAEPSYLLNLPGIYSDVLWRRVGKEVPLEMVHVGSVITYANTTFIRMSESLTLVCDMHINLVGVGTPTLKEVIDVMLDAGKSPADIMFEVASLLK